MSDDQEQSPTEFESLIETARSLSGKPHHHNAWGYRVPLDTSITLDSRVVPCECTDANPDNRPSATRYESDQVRAALKGALGRGFVGPDYLGDVRVNEIVKIIEQDGNIKVEVCSCGPWHPDMDGPSEDCPVHGRSNADLWALAERHRSEAAQARRDAESRAVEAVDAQTQARTALDALRNLVDLKDGPRDEHYEVAKPLAWDVARMMVSSEEKPSGDTVGTDFHKTVQALIDATQPRPLPVLSDMPWRTPPSEPEPDEVTLIVGPEGRVSQVIFHTSHHLTFEDLQTLCEDIQAGTNALVLGEGARVREIVVTRLPEDAEAVVVEEPQEVPQ